MSPSEEKGRALGLLALRIEPTHEPTHIRGAKVFAKFKSPPLCDPGTVMPNIRRHYLNVYAKSRAGAWRIAVRWLRQLQAGKL